MPWLQRSETLESCCVLAVSLRRATRLGAYRFDDRGAQCKHETLQAPGADASS